ncbi:MADS-box protein SOC1 [Olea europaea subsp. europaea]|uniref:MADS-box protein SOC1 n=1 Tax=Olea europaea subsp. europaea TaxID=158383 RepID=A0A8S0TC92_OLEEU|nr:MADS-box protein SOC1 [Olea europaea subsp. europaea]
MMHSSRTLRYWIAFHACDLHVSLVVRFVVTHSSFMLQLHVSATLRPTEAELGQPYISTLLPFEDRTVLALDDVAKDIIPSQLRPEPLASGGNVGNSRGECALVSSGGGSEDDDESGNSDDEGVGEEIGGDKSGDSNGKASDEGDSEDEHTCTQHSGTYSTPPCTDVLLPFMHPPDLMYDKIKPLERASRELRWRNYCWIKERSSKFASAQSSLRSCST